MPSTNSIKYSLIPVFSGNPIAKLDKKMLVYSLYSLGISDTVSSCYKTANNKACKECIDMTDSVASKVVT